MIDFSKPRRQRHKITDDLALIKAGREADRQAALRARPRTAYGFVRVSHIEQFEDGHSLDNQMHQLKRYWECYLKDKGVHWGGIDYEQSNVSASKTPFAKQKAGKRLLNKMVPGDILIVDKVDRLYRKLKDFVKLMELLKEKKVEVHFVSQSMLNVSDDNPFGDFMHALLVLVAELEAKQIGQRTREAFAHMRRQGYYHGSPNHTPLGTKVLGVKGRRHLVWDPVVRGIMAEIVRLRDDDGMEWDGIVAKVNADLKAANGDKFKPYQRPVIQNMYDRELLYRSVPNLDPSRMKISEMEEAAKNGGFIRVPRAD